MLSQKQSQNRTHEALSAVEHSSLPLLSFLLHTPEDR
jgi:hypothetical protein